MQAEYTVQVLEILSDGSSKRDTEICDLLNVGKRWWRRWTFNGCQRLLLHLERRLFIAGLQDGEESRSYTITGIGRTYLEMAVNFV